MEEIVVIGTGTNIRGVENPTVPVLTFDKDDIDLSGAATLDDFLRTIPQNFASETQLSANSGNPNDSGRNRTQGTVVDLRGLGPGSTLTLLNGRRMTAAGESSTVDINVLPLGVIERVDVLTDGATAVYGSDAVGGVINFITRKDYEGFDVRARYGTVTEGSKEDFGVGGAGGLSWGSGGVFAGVDYQETRPLLVEERDFIDLTRAREGSTLGADSERSSVAGGISQNFGPKARLGIDVLYSDVSSESFSLTFGIPQESLSSQKALFVNSRFEYSATDNLTAAFLMDYGRNQVDNMQAFPTIAGFTRSSNFDNELHVYEGRVSGRLIELPGGALSFSVGGLHRGEEYFGDGTAGTAAPVLIASAVRDVWAGYAEVLVPVFGEANALPLIQRFELSFAGRYEDYSDFGNTLDPKVGLYWEVNEGLSFRASYSEAFRAPDLQSINRERTFRVSLSPASEFTAVAPSEFFSTDPDNRYLVIRELGGNPDLGPETAKTWSAGFSYEPSFSEGLSFGGNYFSIDYTNRLEFISANDPVQDSAFREFVDIPPNPTEIRALFDRAAAGEVVLINPAGQSPEDIQAVFANSFQNIAARDVSGFDLNVTYSTDTDIGQFSVGANASYLIDYKARPTPNSQTTEQVNILYRPVDFKLRGSLLWARNGFTVFTAVNYVDGYRDNPDSLIANPITSWTTADLSLAYDAGERFEDLFANGTRIGLSVTNLFDNDPPFVTTPFGLNFDSANANPWGRQVNLTISKKF